MLVLHTVGESVGFMYKSLFIGFSLSSPSCFGLYHLKQDVVDESKLSLFSVIFESVNEIIF